MNRLRTFALIFALTVSPLMAAVVTTAKYTLTNTAWTDMGAGPMLISFKGSGAFAVADVTPASIPVGEGFTLISGDSFYVSSTSHVWGSAQGPAGVVAYVSAY